MKKLTIKQLKEYLNNTTFINRYLSVFKINESDDKIARFMIIYSRYQVQLYIDYETAVVCAMYAGTTDSFDTYEFNNIVKQIKAGF